MDQGEIDQEIAALRAELTKALEVASPEECKR